MNWKFWQKPIEVTEQEVKAAKLADDLAFENWLNASLDDELELLLISNQKNKEYLLIQHKREKWLKHYGSK